MIFILIAAYLGEQVGDQIEKIDLRGLVPITDFVASDLFE